MKEIDANKLVRDLRAIADRVEQKKPGLHERIRKQLFSQDTSILEFLDDHVSIEEVDEKQD
jgi:hypothetical protein